MMLLVCHSEFEKLARSCIGGPVNAVMKWDVRIMEICDLGMLLMFLRRSTVRTMYREFKATSQLF